MFRYAGRPGDMEQLRRFALESYTEAEALEVPPLPSGWLLCCQVMVPSWPGWMLLCCQVMVPCWPA